MDRRHHRTVRLISTFGAITLGALALWSSGISLPQIWADAKQHSAAAGEISERDTGRTSMLPNDKAGDSTDAQYATQTVERYDPHSPAMLRLISAHPGLVPTEGTAIIGTTQNNGVTYVAGAILANGARLSEIYSNYVVLERGSARQKLSLKDLAADPKTLRATASDLSFVAASGADAKIASDASKNALVQVIRTSPVYENDVFVGLQVFPGQSSGVFSQMGLRSGDLVTSMGGAPLSDYDSAMQLLGALVDGSSINLGVRRNGKYEIVSVSGAALARAISTMNEPVISQAPDVLPAE